MRSDLAVHVDHVSKKFCRNLRHAMIYGLWDVGRNMLGQAAPTDRLRPSEFWALDDVSLEIRQGEAIGLIGSNGGGKSTLLKLINAIYWPDRGSITTRGRVGALIAAGAGFHPDLTGAENIGINAAILGMDRHALARRYDAIVEFSEVGDYLDTPVKYYSSGMIVRLGFSVAAHSAPDIMLVDEVLAVGDVAFQAKCFARMAELRSAGTTFVVVSHNMHNISGFVDRIAFIHDHQLRLHDTESGIRAYLDHNLGDDSLAIEVPLAREHGLKIDAIRADHQRLEPGDDLALEIDYSSEFDLADVDVQLELIDRRDHGLHFHRSSRAAGERHDLRRGSRRLRIRIADVRLSSTLAFVVVKVFDRERRQRLDAHVPVEFARGRGLGRTSLESSIVECERAKADPIQPS